jgi:hypothetical protein
MVRFMARAITEGWELPPEKRAEVVASLYGVTQGLPPDGVDRLSAADVVAAARALMKGSEMALAERRLESDEKSADQPKVIVVRRVDARASLPAPEPTEGDRGEGSL